MEWAQRLKIYRRQMGYKQSAAAEVLGVDQSTLSRWERGLFEPTTAAKSMIYNAIAKDDGDVALARQKFIIQNSSERLALFKPDGMILSAMSEASCSHLGIHMTDADGFDTSKHVPEGHIKLYDALRRDGLLKDRDVVRVSAPTIMFDQSLGRWFEAIYHIMPMFTGSGVFSHVIFDGKLFTGEPKNWKDEYVVHSVFGEESFRYE